MQNTIKTDRLVVFLWDREPGYIVYIHNYFNELATK